MDEKALNDLKKFSGKEVIGVKKEDNTLTLSFNKKILFINKTKSFAIKARESLANLSLKALEHETLNEVEVQKNDFLVLKFKNENEPAFILGIKVNTLSEVK